jgi:hypothetical protein
MSQAEGDVLDDDYVLTSEEIGDLAAERGSHTALLATPTAMAYRAAESSA